MRVALSIWPAGFASGLDAVQRGLVDGLSSQDRHETVFVVEEDDRPPDVQAPHRVVTYRRWRRQLNAFGARDVACSIPAGRALRSQGVEAVIGCAHWAVPQIDVPLLATLFEVDYADQAPWHFYASRKRHRMAAEVQRAIRRSSAVLALSNYTAMRARDLFGVDPRRMAVSPPPLLPFDDGAVGTRVLPDRYVVQVGWFHPRKDVKLAIRGWVRARERGLPHSLVLVGRDGPPNIVDGELGRIVLEEAGSYASHVQVLGGISRRELGGVLEGADALLITSVKEGFGIPAIEAAAVGTPVVAVDRASLAEVASPVGTVVRATPDSVATGLLGTIAVPPAADALRAYGRSFTIERQLAPILLALEQLEAGRPVDLRAVAVKR